MPYPIPRGTLLLGHPGRAGASRERGAFLGARGAFLRARGAFPGARGAFPGEGALTYELGHVRTDS